MDTRELKEKKDRLTLYVPKNLCKALKIYSIEVEKDYSEVAIEAFILYLSQNQAKLAGYMHLLSPYLEE